MDRDVEFSLDDVAAEAGISRATVYRYFSDVDLLKLEALLDIRTKVSSDILKGIEKATIRERLLHTQDYFNRLAQEHEPTFRTYLSLVLGESVKKGNQMKKRRGARRIRVLEEVLDPLREQVGDEPVRKLTCVAAALMGIEALIVTKDVCDLDNTESDVILKWGLEMIIKGMTTTGQFPEITPKSKHPT